MFANVINKFKSFFRKTAKCEKVTSSEYATTVSTPNSLVSTSPFNSIEFFDIFHGLLTPTPIKLDPRLLDTFYGCLQVLLVDQVIESNYLFPFLYNIKIYYPIKFNKVDIIPGLINKLPLFKFEELASVLSTRFDLISSVNQLENLLNKSIQCKPPAVINLVLSQISQSINQVERLLKELVPSTQSTLLAPPSKILESPQSSQSVREISIQLSPLKKVEPTDIDLLQRSHLIKKIELIDEIQSDENVLELLPTTKFENQLTTTSKFRDVNDESVFRNRQVACIDPLNFKKSSFVPMESIENHKYSTIRPSTILLDYSSDEEYGTFNTRTIKIDKFSKSRKKSSKSKTINRLKNFFDQVQEYEDYYSQFTIKKVSINEMREARKKEPEGENEAVSGKENAEKVVNFEFEIKMVNYDPTSPIDEGSIDELKERKRDKFKASMHRFKDKFKFWKRENKVDLDDPYYEPFLIADEDLDYSRFDPF
ncbi:unnamed protein product [Candida verbasci]|uniref:Uncharacterized protein n=1 Tax=Candida verbasci TaxID=1227364 RepID=A0A9W4U094_9ASCO|nr:unnamed protein product [Candida verbasci]